MLADVLVELSDQALELRCLHLCERRGSLGRRAGEREEHVREAETR